MTDPSDTELAREWKHAAARAEIAASLEEIYADVARRVRERGPACWASGRCCNFVETGHLLYVTGLEAAYTLNRLAFHQPQRLSLPQLAASHVEGGCPFQQRNLCGVHPIRPLGCRVYFCDRTARVWQQELYEQALKRVRLLHDERGITYRYQEWRSLLELLVSEH